MLNVSGGPNLPKVPLSQEVDHEVEVWGVVFCGDCLLVVVDSGLLSE